MFFFNFLLLPCFPFSGVFSILESSFEQTDDPKQDYIIIITIMIIFINYLITVKNKQNIQLVYIVRNSFIKKSTETAINTMPLNLTKLNKQKGK